MSELKCKCGATTGTSDLKELIDKGWILASGSAGSVCPECRKKEMKDFIESFRKKRESKPVYGTMIEGEFKRSSSMSSYGQTGRVMPPGLT